MCATWLSPDACTGVVDVCLIPEVNFSLDKLCSYVGEVLEKKGHAVVCVAEGAGQVRGSKGVEAAQAGGRAGIRAKMRRVRG